MKRQAAGDVINAAPLEPGAHVLVVGQGGIGLSVIQGARMAGANRIVGVDIHPARETRVRLFGVTHFVNPKEISGDVAPHLVEPTKAARITDLIAAAMSI